MITSTVRLGGIALAQAIPPTATHFSVMWSVSLSSVVCHIRAPCLNRSTDLNAIRQVHLWSPMTHCVRWRSLTPGKARFWVEPPAKACNCELLLPPGE